jgi:hypothetical protein
MRILLVILSLFAGSHCFTQSASFKEIKLRPKAEKLNTKEFTIVYPLVFTKNSNIDELINSQVKNGLLGFESDTSSLQSALNSHIGEGLINLSYTVTFNKLGLLSFFTLAEGCGAHCSVWRTYFNFDLATGRQITINDLFLASKFESFKSMVKKKKKAALSKYKSESKEDAKADSVGYDWAMTLVDDCMQRISVDKFSLSGKTLQIIDDCEFPHAIRALEPGIALHYSYQSISKLLNPRFARLLR